jgi:hypothetical protein
MPLNSDPPDGLGENGRDDQNPSLPPAEKPGDEAMVNRRQREANASSVANGEMLASDPDYPDRTIVQKLAEWLSARIFPG